MRKFLPSFSAAAFGLGVLASTGVDAQIPTTGRAEAALAASKTPPEPVKMQDANKLIGASVSTTGGKYGSVADLVVDGTGNVQYALVEREGKFHPVPFSLMQFGATGDVSLSVSSATLDALTVDRNNLQSLTDREFAAKLRSTFGPNVAREVAASAGTAATTGVASSRANRDRVFSLAGMLGGNIAAKSGSSPGTIATAAINPNGTISYFVGSNAAGDARFAVPFSQATLNSDFNGLSVDVTGQSLLTATVPQNTLPAMTEQSFAASIQSTFGSGITNDSRGIAGGIDGMTKQESDVLRRNDQSNRDPVAGAGDPRRGGADAVAGAGDSRRGGADAVAMAGDSRRGGADAVARPGDRATPGGTVNDRSTTTGSTTGGLVNSPPQTGTTPQRSGNSENGLLQFRDLLNLRIQAQDGAFGRVSDIVLDQNGNVQYMLGSYQGQTFPLPLNQAALANVADGTLSYNVPRATLQELSIDARNLPSMQNQQFTQRMQQVFGDGFRSAGAQSAYPPTAWGPGEGVGNGRPPGGAGVNSGVGAVKNPPRAGSGAQTGTRPNGATSTQDDWRWPGGWGPGEGVGNGRPPGGAGVNSGPPIRGTGTGSGIRTNSGAMKKGNAGNWGPGEGVGNGRPPGGAGVDSGPPVRRTPNTPTGNQGGANKGNSGSVPPAGNPGSSTGGAAGGTGGSGSSGGGSGGGSGSGS